MEHAPFINGRRNAARLGIVGTTDRAKTAFLSGRVIIMTEMFSMVRLLTEIVGMIVLMTEIVGMVMLMTEILDIVVLMTEMLGMAV